VHGDDLRALESDPDVEGLSVDAIIRAEQASAPAAPDESQVKELVRATPGLTETSTKATKSALP
jgi:hypothetical protein